MIVREDIYRDSILYYHYICSKENWQGRTHRWACLTQRAHLNFLVKVHLDTQNNFGNCGIYVYVHDRLTDQMFGSAELLLFGLAQMTEPFLGSPKGLSWAHQAHQRKIHGHVPKNTTYIAHYCCCLLVLRLRQNIQGVPKKQNWPSVHCTAGPNVKNPPKIRLKKNREIDGL